MLRSYNIWRNGQGSLGNETGRFRVIDGGTFIKSEIVTTTVQISPDLGYGLGPTYMTTKRFQQTDVGDKLDLGKGLDSFLQTQQNTAELLRRH